MTHQEAPVVREKLKVGTLLLCRRTLPQSSLRVAIGGPLIVHSLRHELAMLVLDISLPPLLALLCEDIRRMSGHKTAEESWMHAIFAKLSLPNVSSASRSLTASCSLSKTHPEHPCSADLDPE